MSLSYSMPVSAGLSPRSRWLLLAASFGSLLFAFFLLGFTHPASAASCSFVSVGTNDFNTAGNWTCGQVPTGADDVLIGASTSVTMSAAAVVQSVSVSGTLSAVSFLLDVTSTATIISGGVVTSTSGTMKFNSVTSTGTLSSGTGNLFVTTTFQNNGTFNVGSGFATTTGALTNAVSGTINNNTGRLVLLAAFTNSGTFNSNTGTVFLRGSDANIGGASFYNLTVDKTAGQTATMTASSTVTNAFSVLAGTLSVNSRTLNVSGTYANAATVTLSSGTILHPAESADFTDGSGGAVSGYTEGGSVYVTVQDSNHNYDGTVAETMTITITQGNPAIDGDQETLTLTETGVATGIFRNSGATLSYALSAAPGNGTFEARAAGSLSGTYTDTQDAADTAAVSESFTMTTTAATQSSTGGGGLSSGGGGGSPVYAVPQTLPLPNPVVTGPYVVSQVLAGTPSINADKGLTVAVGATAKCASGSLIKLPNDGNAMTHEDEAVYYCGANGRRYAFPNAGTFFSWYDDFSGVMEISASDMASLQLGGNVTYRPGKRMVKIQTDPKVYAIMQGGVLRWVPTEAVARALYGENWNTMISDVPDTFFTNYQMGGQIN